MKMTVRQAESEKSGNYLRQSVEIAACLTSFECPGTENDRQGGSVPAVKRHYDRTKELRVVPIGCMLDERRISSGTRFFRQGPQQPVSKVQNRPAPKSVLPLKSGYGDGHAQEEGAAGIALVWRRVAGGSGASVLQPLELGSGKGGL
jgi:hypothetical protein